MTCQTPEFVQEYLSAYRYKIELHAHTSPCSACSNVLAADLIRAIKEQQYDAVVITNHFYADAPFMKTDDPVGTYLEDFRIAREEGMKRGVRVLLGAEYRFTENINDYLVYGVDEAFLRETVKKFDMGVEAFYREYHRESLIIIQAHPFRNGMSLVAPQFLDGIEAMNMHPKHNSRVAVAVQYAVEQNFKLVTIGTDIHGTEHAGISALRTRVLPENEEQLVEILHSRDYIFEVGGCPMLPFVQL